MQRSATTGWRRTIGLAALGAAVLTAGAGAPAAAQQARSAPDPSPTAQAIAAELARVLRERREATLELERFTATLRSRPVTPLVSDSLAALVRAHAALTSRVTQLQARLRFAQTESRLRQELARERPSAPAGWFGVSVEEFPSAPAQSSGRVLLSAEYPKVLSVEPGSPAARAGLQAGDRLVAISGVDLRARALDLAEALQPGRRLPVRFARDGSVQDVLVTITPRPRTFVSGVTTMRVVTTDERGGEPAGSARTPRTEQRRQVTVRALPPGAVAITDGAPMPFVFLRGESVGLVAGAEVLRLTPELRTALDVRDEVRDGGVFVVQVLRGTPAERAGLLQGDVLLRANGVTLASPLVLQRVVAEAHAADAPVRLDLVRAKRARTVELRW